ncbi:protein of unknown function DUF324 [Thermincola potens JR]|uniref:CRISPR type III-associated protein domain-containing protein n=2 Tax=Thermincola TaxID=278993 RepID=D5XAW1_THEPJ|nr:protein of unknown function DUF324 [Thermincola potens JR]
MAYKVITGTLKARTAVHIGTGEGNDLTDALIRRDAEGQPFIPGTAIAGVLRTLVTRLAPRLGKEICRALNEKKEERVKSCNCAVCRLFGDINPSDADGSTSAASRLLVFNAYPSNKDSESQIMNGSDMETNKRFYTQVRDGVGIDRVTGTAARLGAVKFDLEVLPSGSTFELRMELRSSGLEDEILLAAALAEWENGRLWLGGRIGRGLGAFDLHDLQFKTFSLDTPVKILDFLKDDTPWQKAQPKEGWIQERLDSVELFSTIGKPKTVIRGWLSLTGTLQAEGPLLSNDAVVAGIYGFDHAPLFSLWNDDKGFPILPGAGLRGVLRSHAERLARTLATLQAEDKDDFLRRCPACNPNLRHKSKNGANETNEKYNEIKRILPLESCDWLITKATKANILSNNEDGSDMLCLACRMFGSPRLGSRLIVEDAHYQSSEKQSEPDFKLKMLDFLAIDRFTGGGAEGAKFDALALWCPAFDFRLYMDNPEPWQLGWLWLVLRDLSEGWLTVGFGRAKGFGRLKLTRWTANFGYLLPEDAPPGLAHLGLTNTEKGVFTTTEITSEMEEWISVAQGWVNEFRKTVEQFKRSEKVEITDDSYFGLVDGRYPLKCIF